MSSANEYEQHYEISREHKGLSLFDFLDAVAGPVDRKRVSSAARDKRLRLNGEPVSPGATLRVGDLVELGVPVETLARTQPPLVGILHVDDTLVVADKPSGIAFAEGRRGGVAATRALADRYPGTRPVHRLDKQTSGLLVMGKSDTANKDNKNGRISIFVENHRR